MTVLNEYFPEKGDRVRVKALDFRDSEGVVDEVRFSAYFGDYLYILDLKGVVPYLGFRNYELEKIG